MRNFKVLYLNNKIKCEENIKANNFRMDNDIALFHGANVEYLIAAYCNVIYVKEIINGEINE